MNQSMILCLLLALIGHIIAAPIDEGLAGGCPDGSPNGSQMERGRFFYECRDSNFVPKGCITDDLKHIDIGQTADRKTYRLKCSLNSDNNLAFEAFACLFQGSEHQIDEQWEDGQNFYTCKKDSRNLPAVKNLGCIDQGKHVPLNEKITKDDFVMACNESVNNGAHLVQIGCVKEGRQYNVGDSFEVGKFWFTCTRTGREKVALKSSGCVNNGKRLNDGDRYVENDVIYECTIDGDKTDVRSTGCVQTDGGNTVERRLGCTWVEGTAPFQYELSCQHDPTTNTAKKVPVRCNYNAGGGVYNIDIGCYRIVDKAVFGCSKDGANLKLQSYQGDNAEQSAQGAGLHAC
jgi:hypothetical protein